ncbi:hypothetical protein B0H17DRAFT_1191770 [Mycena rosella]|uniref:Uncharacterized protein n=1 Tax=Mycena rosella TaxID=1033263 RepID=A0AAD7MAP1_MYCRO|nr:hypothetical protein B0H17DRAFT_1191770 [Mycena rosella]
MAVENFDIFLDIDDRFLISINPCTSDADVGMSYFKEQDDARSWDIFNALYSEEDIDRNATALDLAPASPTSQWAQHFHSSQRSESMLLPPASMESASIPPRREYVWRTVERGQQSLETISRLIARELEMQLPSLKRLAGMDGRGPHRCAGYIREEITLTTTTAGSAVVAHDSPSPLEICSICHEVVGDSENFRCVCGASNPGTQPTVKCRRCNFWSHSDCVPVRNPKKFICWTCSSVPVLPCVVPISHRRRDDSRPRPRRRRRTDTPSTSGSSSSMSSSPLWFPSWQLGPQRVFSYTGLNGERIEEPPVVPFSPPPKKYSPPVEEYIDPEVIFILCSPSSSSDGDISSSLSSSESDSESDSDIDDDREPRSRAATG